MDSLTIDRVAALFKTGDRTNASNYRPISILPTMSKILEKVVVFSILFFFYLKVCSVYVVNIYLFRF